VSDHEHSDYSQFDHRHLDLVRDADRLDQVVTRLIERVDQLSRRLLSVEEQAGVSRDRLDMLNADYPPQLEEVEPRF
jgi:hypothetical protein